MPLRIAVVQQNGNPGKPDVRPDEALVQRASNPWYRRQRPELYYGIQAANGS